MERDTYIWYWYSINLLTYFKGKVTTMLVANSRELRFIIIGSDFKWESITAARTMTSAPGGTAALGGCERGCPIGRGLRNCIYVPSYLVCKHNKKLHKSKTSDLKNETRMIYTQKRTRIKELTGWSDWEDVVWRGNHRCR